jgi:plasmid maintenance system antidote protein VapI
VSRRTGEPPHHNNLTCYTDYGCRLPECVERKNEWQRERRRQQREGQPALIDAEPVRQHILALQAAGISTHRIATVAGINDWAVRRFVPSTSGRRARKHRTTPEIARKILAVTPETAAPGYVNSTGTRRRIQALAAAGWPLNSMADSLGIHPHYVSDLLYRADHPVYRTTAEKVARGYDELKSKKPARRRSIDPRAIKRIRDKAAANRWPDPAYWADRMDVIDDPEFEPMYGVTRREIVAHDANEVMRLCGLDRHAAAERLGVTKSYIDHAFREYPQYALEVAA